MFGTNRSYPRTGREGQALLVAVLLMMVILLTGVLFVAIVSYNQEQSARSSDVVAAQSLAEAGIEWCNTNLINSPQGADWRPPFRALDPGIFDPADPDTWPVPPVLGSDGTDYGVYGPLGVEGDEDDYYTDFEIARGWHGEVDAANPAVYRRFGFVRIPNVNATPTGTGLPSEIAALLGKGHILVRVTYDPDPPYEPNDILTAGPDTNSGQIKIESIGVVDEQVPVFRKLVAYKPIGLTDYALFVTDSGKSGRPTKLGFEPWTDMDYNGTVGTGDYLGQFFFGPIKVNGTLQLGGSNTDLSPTGSSTFITLTTQPTQAVAEVPGINPMVIGGGYLRADRVEAADSITEPDPANLSTSVIERAADGSTSAPAQLVPSGTGFSTLSGLIRDGSQSVDAAGFSRESRPLAAPAAFENGGADRYRALSRDSGDVRTLTPSGLVNLGRLGRGRGMYIDNVEDRQFVDSSGVSDLDMLIAEWMQQFPEGQYSGQSRGWNATYTTYTPPGVEIVLYPTEEAAREFGTPPIDTSDTPPNSPGTLWWPGHVAGEPGIKITRHDRAWEYVNGGQVRNSDAWTMYIDYPDYPNQVIFAEGNVRIRGVLPARPAGGRDYNLTVVSGGTIYIDGQILSPQDGYGRNPGTGAGYTPGQPVPDEHNTKIALLARDCVTLNATRLAPQIVAGDISAAPDDPVNPDPLQQHWELSAETSGAAYTSWMFGEPVAAGHRVGISVLHTAQDPGPAAMSMSVYDYVGGWTWRPFIFNTAPVDTQGDRFYFVQQGLLTAPADAANVERALTPDWGQRVATSPAVPFDIGGYLSDENGGSGMPAYMRSIAISAADPMLAGAGAGSGSTEYWLKKWKVYEDDGAGNPTGAIHAKINALIYAENGCWFVIPGSYYDASRQSTDPAAQSAFARRMRRYNYDICVRGTITEAFHAEPEAVRDWSDKWAYPVGAGGWGTIRYEFDESLRRARDQAITTLSGNQRVAAAVLATEQANLPVLPLLPVSPDLVFYGEGW